MVEMKMNYRNINQDVVYKKKNSRKIAKGQWRMGQK